MCNLRYPIWQEQGRVVLQTSVTTTYTIILGEVLGETFQLLENSKGVEKMKMKS